jgi:hypothetical protein
MGLESLGGNMPAGRPAAVFAGRMTHVFAIGAGGVMNHWKSSSGLHWTGPDVLLSGDTTLAASYPCALTLKNGSVHVFAIGNGGPFANGGPLLHWSSPDGVFFPPPVSEPAWPIPGSGNGVACTSSAENQIDAFAVTQFGMVRYSWNGDTNVSLGAAPMPDGTNLPRCVPAAASSGPNDIDVFAVDADGNAVRWHGPLSAPIKTVLPRPDGARAGPLVRAGFAAVSPSPGHVELFAVTSDGRLTTWSFDGATTNVAQLSAPPMALHDSVPVAVMVDGHLEVFAIGQPINNFTGGQLVRWRRDRGEWSEPTVLGGNLAAGGLGAAAGTNHVHTFGFNSGADNSLQHWPAGIGGSTLQPWENWAANQRSAVEGHCYPTSLEEVVAIVKTAAYRGSQVRAVGSSWSLSDVALTSGYVVETSALDRIIKTVIPAALLGTVTSAMPGAGAVKPKNLIHVEAGMQLERLMGLLDGANQAPFTMGGASGQTLAGLMSTSVHGSDFNLPPFPDAIRAIHLVASDGRQHWIEPDSARITDELALSNLLGPGVTLHYNDDWFDAALVSVGSLGIIYAVVIEVTEQYWLEERCEQLPWRDVPAAPGVPGVRGLRSRLADGSVFSAQIRTQLTDGSVFIANRRCVQVAVDTTMAGDDPTCFLTSRVEQSEAQAMASIGGAPFSLGGEGPDILGAFCEVDMINILFTVGMPLGATFATALAGALATVGLAPLIPLAMPLAAASVPLLIAGIKAGPPGSLGDVISAVLNAVPSMAPEVVKFFTDQAIKVGTPDGSPGGTPTRRDIAHQIMAPWNKGECFARAHALEMAFDATDGSYLSFLDAAFAML